MSSVPPVGDFIGVVTQSSPLRVRRDVPGSVAPNVTPINTVGFLLPGDKVVVRKMGGTWWVAGVLGGPKWRTFVPYLRGETVNPNGYVPLGRYVVDGNTCRVEITITTPESWSRGDGNYRVVLPLPPVGYTFDHRATLTGEFSDGTASMPLVGRIENTETEVNRILRLLPTGIYQNINASQPATAAWRINLSGEYRVA